LGAFSPVLRRVFNPAECLGGKNTSAYDTVFTLTLNFCAAVLDLLAALYIGLASCVDPRVASGWDTQIRAQPLAADRVKNLWKKMKKELSILGGNPQSREEIAHTNPEMFIMLIPRCGMVHVDLWLGPLAGGK
jgi:hypothetical protein